MLRRESRQREADALYERTCSRARGTEDAFVKYHELQERLVKLNDQARESARASSIARSRYREGLTDFLALLDASAPVGKRKTRWPSRIASVVSVSGLQSARRIQTETTQ